MGGTGGERSLKLYQRLCGRRRRGEEAPRRGEVLPLGERDKGGRRLAPLEQVLELVEQHSWLHCCGELIPRLLRDFEHYWLAKTASDAMCRDQPVRRAQRGLAIAHDPLYQAELLREQPVGGLGVSWQHRGANKIGVSQQVATLAGVQCVLGAGAHS